MQCLAVENVIFVNKVYANQNHLNSKPQNTIYSSRKHSYPVYMLNILKWLLMGKKKGKGVGIRMKGRELLK